MLGLMRWGAAIIAPLLLTLGSAGATLWTLSESEASHGAQAGATTLTVNVSIIPPPYLAKDPGNLNLLIDGVVVVSNVRDIPGLEVDASTGKLALAPGIPHTISQTGSPGTEVSDYSGELSCIGDGAFVLQTGDTSWDVTLDPGSSPACTLRETRGFFPAGATLIVEKVAQDGDGSFGFSANASVPGTTIEDAGVPSSFTIDTAGGIGMAFFGVGAVAGYPAKVVIREDRLPQSWVLVGLQCSLTSGSQSTWRINDAQATITLHQLEAVTCTYTDRKRR